MVAADVVADAAVVVVLDASACAVALAHAVVDILALPSGSTNGVQQLMVIVSIVALAVAGAGVGAGAAVDVLTCPQRINQRPAPSGGVIVGGVGAAVGVVALGVAVAVLVVGAGSICCPSSVDQPTGRRQLAA
jgi:hypothetical protein